MPVEEMGVDDRRKYLSQMKKRYDAAGRIERAGLLDEMEQVTEMHRKSLIRLLSRHDLSREPRLKERGREYGAEVDDAIRVIAESLDFVCAERLTPALPAMARPRARNRSRSAGIVATSRICCAAMSRAGSAQCWPRR